MKYLILLVVILQGNLTAYSQITGIDRETKVEIVSTIKSYDAVLIELDLTNDLLKEVRKLNELYLNQITIKNELILNLESQIITHRDENNVLGFEVKRQKAKSLFIGGSGIIILIISLIIK